MAAEKAVPSCTAGPGFLSLPQNALQGVRGGTALADGLAPKIDAGRKRHASRTDRRPPRRRESAPPAGPEKDVPYGEQAAQNEAPTKNDSPQTPAEGAQTGPRLVRTVFHHADRREADQRLKSRLRHASQLEEDKG
jgi:hypothetical protein